MALEGTTDKVYAALNGVIVKTRDGVEHMIHFTKDLVLHGGNGPGVDAFVGLEEGTPIVVHYIVANADETALEIDRVGDKGLQTTEGLVVGIDRRHRRITIKYANGQQEVMQLTPTAAAEASRDVDEAWGSHGATKVVVYYTDEAGKKIAHYFKKSSTE
jgi:hypothetical protein